MEKTCKICKKTLDIDLFEYKKGKPFDRGCYCKKCRNELSKKYRAEHRSYYVEYNKNYVRKRDYIYPKIKREVTEQRRAYLKIYWQTHKRKLTYKHYARTKLWKAVKSGVVLKLPCCECGNIISEAHHPNYSKPLEVLWLCKKHHSLLHRDIKASDTIRKL